MHDPVAGLAFARRFGPWADDLDPGERVARLRSLRALARVLAGPRAVELCELLHQAETDPAALAPAADALDALASLDLRRVLSSYAGLSSPLSPRRGAGAGVRAFPRPVLMVTPWPVTPGGKRRAGRWRSTHASLSRSA